MDRINIEGRKVSHSTFESLYKPRFVYSLPTQSPSNRFTGLQKSGDYHQSSNIKYDTGYFSRVVPDKDKSLSQNCLECSGRIRKESELHHEIGEKQGKLSQCLKFIDELVEESNFNKKKQKAVQEENLRLQERIRRLEKLECQKTVRDSVYLTSSKKTYNLSFQRKDNATKEKQVIFENQNLKLRQKILELQNQKKLITQNLDEVIKSKEIIQNLYNSFKLNHLLCEGKGSGRIDHRKQMEQQLRQLKEKCFKLESSTKDSMTEYKQKLSYIYSNRNQKQNLLEQQNSHLNKKVQELKELYKISEVKRFQLQKKLAQEKQHYKQKVLLSKIQQKALKWENISVEKDQIIQNLKRNIESKSQQIDMMNETINKLTEKNSSNQQKIIKLIKELAQSNKETSALQSKLIQTTKALDGEYETLGNEIQTLKKQFNLIQEKNHELQELKIQSNKKIEQLETQAEYRLNSIIEMQKVIIQLNQQLNYAKQQNFIYEKQIQLLKQNWQSDNFSLISEFQLKLKHQKQNYNRLVQQNSKINAELKDIKSVQQAKVNQIQNDQSCKIKQLEQKLEKKRELENKNLNEDFFFNQIIDKELKINNLQQQNLRLSKLIEQQQIPHFRNSKNRSTCTSEPENEQYNTLRDSLNKLKIENQSLLNQAYEKDMKITEMNRQLGLQQKSKTIENIKTTHSDNEQEG